MTRGRLMSSWGTPKHLKPGHHSRQLRRIRTTTISPRLNLHRRRQRGPLEKRIMALDEGFQSHCSLARKMRKMEQPNTMKTTIATRVRRRYGPLAAQENPGQSGYGHNGWWWSLIMIQTMGQLSRGLGLISNPPGGDTVIRGLI